MTMTHKEYAFISTLHSKYSKLGNSFSFVEATVLMPMHVLCINATPPPRRPQRGTCLIFYPSGKSSSRHVLSVKLPNHVSVTATKSKSFDKMKSQKDRVLFFRERGLMQRTFELLCCLTDVRDSNFILVSWLTVTDFGRYFGRCSVVAVDTMGSMAFGNIFILLICTP